MGTTDPKASFAPNITTANWSPGVLATQEVVYASNPIHEIPTKSINHEVLEVFVVKPDVTDNAMHT